MELRFLESKDLLFLRLLLLVTVVVFVPAAAEGLVRVHNSLTGGRKLSKTKGSFAPCSMDTLLGRFGEASLKLLRMHSLEGIFDTSCSSRSSPRRRAICDVAAKATDAGPPRRGEDTPRRADDGSAGSTGDIVTFS